jgi:hypothetical protein
VVLVPFQTLEVEVVAVLEVIVKVKFRVIPIQQLPLQRQVV